MPGGLLQMMAGPRPMRAPTTRDSSFQLSPFAVEDPVRDVFDRVPVERLVQRLRSETDVRSCQYVRQPAKRMSCWKRLLLEYIDCKTSNLVVFERTDQRRLFDQRPARSVDQVGRRLHPCKLG